MQLIDGAVLRRAQVPAANAAGSEIETFALGFDGYAAFGNRLGALTNDLRGCLFFEQRRWRHQMSRPADSRPCPTEFSQAEFIR